LDPLSAHSDIAFACLRHLGKQVCYARYTGEDHREGEWSYPNMVDYWNRVIAWFSEHLADQEPSTLPAGT
ncbi:MAG: hypothetical protein LC772_04780, partial [Chloroflexi bacterium]|nr:hypothetical protein [Chloroflexota bacterium]